MKERYLLVLVCGIGQTVCCGQSGLRSDTPK